MLYAAFLWGLVWGGMFTGLYNVSGALMGRSLIGFIQGARAFFPLLALYLAVIWVLAKRPKFPFVGNPLGFLFGYCGIGFLSSLFISPEPGSSMYWLGLYLAPLMVTWFCLEKDEALRLLRGLIVLNYGIFFLMTLSLMPESLRIGWGRLPDFQQYKLPLGLGLIRTNGAGRFALVVIVVCIVRFFHRRSPRGYLWLAGLLPSLFLLVQTQSRTSLLGLAVASILFVILRGVDWRYFVVGPAAAGAIYVSGVKWRARGELLKLLTLTGREYTWQRGLEQIEASPFMGWGFNADRILLQSEHMHNSYLHSAIHAGIFGGLFFVAALASAWLLILKRGLLHRSRLAAAADRPFLFESIMIVGFLTARSFFESTATFYGVDLLLLIPAIAYIALLSRTDFDAPAASGEPV